MPRLNCVNTSNSVSVRHKPKKSLKFSLKLMKFCIHLGQALQIRKLINDGVNVNGTCEIQEKSISYIHLTSMIGKFFPNFFLLIVCMPILMSSRIKYKSINLTINKYNHFTDYAYMADILARRGADVNVPNVNGYTALHIACENGFENVVDSLLTNKANVNHQDKNGQSALHAACKMGNLRSKLILRSNILKLFSTNYLHK